jgi:hypothetical protein
MGTDVNDDNSINWEPNYIIRIVELYVSVN